MCIHGDFDRMTESQRMRDAAFLGRMWRRYVVPLAQELEEAVPGYGAMGAYEKFVALMRLNEEHAPDGTPLPLDLAVVEGGIDEDGRHVAYANGRASGLVFSGRSDQYEMEDRNGVAVYSARIAGGRPIGIDRGGKVDAASLDDSTLPLPFRVALLALYVRQNVFVTTADSCRFAAGIVRNPELRRWFIDGIESDQRQLFGWTVHIRDTTPTNELVIYLAQQMRRSAERAERAHRLYSGARSVAELDQGAKRRRTRQQSTELLVWFIDEYLPSQGMHVGRTGSGEHVSWKRAYEMFDEMHPGLYKDFRSFSNSYHNAKRARKDGDHGTH